MNTLAYALAGCLLILAAPMVAADPTDSTIPNEATTTSGCSVFGYWLEPSPGYRLDLDCLADGG